jgi:hypothetical protein
MQGGVRMTLTPTPRQMAGGNFYKNAFMYDKVLERISHQPTMMDYVCGPPLAPRHPGGPGPLFSVWCQL